MTDYLQPSQTRLFRQPNTWLHFIGGYYRTSDLFLVEAQAHGFSRRIPAQVARGMHFGDQVVFLRYGGQTVYAFGEGVLTRVAFDAQIAMQLGEELARRGLADYSLDGGQVTRACGEYLVTGTWKVVAEIDLPELIEAALRIAQSIDREPLFVMVGGDLTAAYTNPVFLQPAPRFTRGFIKAEPGSTFRYTGAPTSSESKILAVKQYRKAERATRGRPLPRLARAGKNNQGQKSLNF
jgi:hypothetical protein